MRLVYTDVQLVQAVSADFAYRVLEEIGRTAYKSEEKITPESAIPFLRKIIKMGHESVLEHVSVTVRYITDRATTHALVRHRVAAYTQESTIYCDYVKKGCVSYRDPFFIAPSSEAMSVWLDAMSYAEKAYNKLRELGCSPGVARDVLPNATKTELVATHNIREWRHIFKVRAAPGDSHSMHLLMAMTFNLLRYYYPILFEDFEMPEAYLKALKIEEEHYDLDS